MASIVFETGVESHPTISIDNINLIAGRIDFRWIGAGHRGDCSERFEISTAEHGELTINEMVALFTDYMIEKIEGESGGE